MLAPDGSVAVLDNASRFLEYTTSGKARRLLKTGEAIIWSHDPFIIKLLREVSDPHYRWRAEMKYVNFTEYFKQEREVFVQNISNSQVTLEFDVGNGRVDSWLCPPDPRPINLTQHFPFAVLKQSMAFRKILSRRPACLVLLDEEEYRKMYETTAKEQGLFVEMGGEKVPDVDRAIEEAENYARVVQMKEPLPDAKPLEPLHEVVEDDPHFGGKKRVASRDMIAADDLINPRVLHLCNQVKHEIPDTEKMPAAQMLRELKQLETSLKIDDWEYVRAHGHYKSVKKLAKDAINNIAAAAGEADDDTEE